MRRTIYALGVLCVLLLHVAPIYAQPPTPTETPTETPTPGPTPTPMVVAPNSPEEWNGTTTYLLAFVAGKLLLVALTHIPMYHKPMLILVDYAILLPFLLMDIFVFAGNMYLINSWYLVTVVWLWIFVIKLLLSVLTQVGNER